VTAGSQAQTNGAALVRRAGIAAVAGRHTKATHVKQLKAAGKSASAPGHLKAPRDVVKTKTAHPTPAPHSPATSSGPTTHSVKPATTPPAAQSKTNPNGPATTDKPAKSGATPATPAVPASPGTRGSGTATTPATTAIPATPEAGKSNGSKAGGDPSPAAKGNGKDS